MKKAHALLLLFFSLSLHAQGTGAFAKMDRIAAQAVLAQKALRPVPSVKPVRFPPPTYYNKQFARMEHTVQQPLDMKPSRQLPLVNYTNTVADYIKYQKVMNEFVTFKQQANPFLYYQTKSRRTLEPEEKRQWLERIYHIKQQLASLRGVVSVQERSLRGAYTYLNEVLRTVSPNAALFAVPQPYQERPDRVYQADEFFLHAPKFSPWVRMLQQVGLPVGGIKPLPKNLKIVMFNDDFFYLSAMKELHKKGKLFPGCSVSFSQDANEFLHRVLRGDVMPDLVITDICASSTSGITLTQELRNAGYTGAIIALTGYTEQGVSGFLFMKYGFDGIIANPGYNLNSSSCTRLLRSLQYYFYYRDLHGWIR